MSEGVGFLVSGPSSSAGPKFAYVCTCMYNIYIYVYIYIYISMYTADCACIERERESELRGSVYGIQLFNCMPDVRSIIIKGHGLLQTPARPDCTVFFLAGCLSQDCMLHFGVFETPQSRQWTSATQIQSVQWPSDMRHLELSQSFGKTMSRGSAETARQKAGQKTGGFSQPSASAAARRRQAQK